MSYCRWSECDVYAYDSCEGGVQFYVAGSDSLNRLCGTYSEAYQYAKELRDKHGLDVPSYAIDALREDAIDEAKRHFGPDSAVAELISENAKLRDERDRIYKANVEKNGEILRLLEENAKLREELSKWKRLTAGIDLPEYPVTQFKPKDLERENTKLWELARHMHTCMEHYEPDGSVSCDRCPLDNDTGNCDFERRMQELRDKVDR